MYIFILFYTALLLAGGMIGYFKAHSLPSLIMGLISTIFLIFFTSLYRRGSKGAGYGLLVIVLALDSFFSWRWIKTGSLFPAGVFSVLSTILLIIITLHIQKQLKK